MDGSLLQWTRPQQVVGLAVAIALGWLITTTRTAA
jgi:high-affinity Fe2+/Pb2+ permease